MKKLIFIALILFASQVFAQTEVNNLETVRPQHIEILMDSSTVDTTFKVNWLGSSSSNRWYPSGYNSLWFEVDTTTLATQKPGASDSLYINVKPLIPDSTYSSTAATNDSLNLTPTWSTSGLDFEFEVPYVYDFTLPQSAGVEVRVKWISEAGGIILRFKIPR